MVCQTNEEVRRFKDAREHAHMWDMFKRLALMVLMAAVTDRLFNKTKR